MEDDVLVADELDQTEREQAVLTEAVLELYTELCAQPAVRASGERALLGKPRAATRARVQVRRRVG